MLNFLFVFLLISAFAQEEVQLWPEDSKVLKEGIKIIAEDKDSDHNPELTIDHPSFFLYPAKSSSPTPAILVFPGGGYQVVAIGKESTIGYNGADVCKWLTDNGITCVLVKYRVPNSGCYWSKRQHKHVTPEIPMALQDAHRAMSLVRYNAQKYNIDTAKIGVMGFSAGGNLTVRSSTDFNKRSYEPIDDADKMKLRPDFAIPVYPGHLTMEHMNTKSKELNTDIKISKDIPTTLLIHAKDDPVDPVHYSEVYARELKKAGVPVKLILYKTGGHAFGVKKQGKDTDRWTNDAVSWLKEIKVL
ncbi:MAG: alpha/beta hydrolase [Bacteriovoracaceae bacterium]